MSKYTRSKANQTDADSWFDEMMNAGPATTRDSRGTQQATGSGSDHLSGRSLPTIRSGPRAGTVKEAAPVLGEEEKVVEEAELDLCIKEGYSTIGDCKRWKHEALAICYDYIYPIAPSLVGAILCGEKRARDIPVYGTGEGRQETIDKLVKLKALIDKEYATAVDKWNNFIFP